MDERKLLGSSDFAVLLRNQGMYPGTHFPGPWEGRPATNTFDRPLFKPVELDDFGDDDSDDSLHHQEKKRRLTTDQIQFLENSFESENKLEPERKTRLAQVLGLKPRQVAIWFQNRRARWKTKQLEKDYEALKSSYDGLKVDHECLLKEKEELEAEVLSLTRKLLQKERNGCLESSEFNDRCRDKLPNPESPSSFNDLRQTVARKQEDISSANSTILDCGSPACIDEGGYSMLMELTSSSNAFELDNSDRSQIGEADDASDYDFLALEDNSCGYGLLWS
ncbi:homeobox-leucine zipper protein HAT5-like [Zingiber officinale]|uniref:homeobox-leucine zipper protein HAT5-like n=1 Tax=Zingiber officinale TaxID=94328 RepID=UPI001C4C2F0D|nr:homeobox-leucine zipper protein HAT5-like [Zingiber officinale]